MAEVTTALTGMVGDLVEFIPGIVTVVAPIFVILVGIGIALRLTRKVGARQ